MAANSPHQHKTTISSPFVRIEGQANGSTQWFYTGAANTSCLYWTANPFGGEFDGSGGLYNVTINGYGTTGATYGLTTCDISGFVMRNVVIQNFTGVNAVGWNDITVSGYNEKFDVQDLSLQNNTSGWTINPGGGSPGYPATTFGYGKFNVKFEVWSGQTGLQMVNGSIGIL